MKGTIRQYFSGTGWITGDDGQDYFLHYKNLLMNERLYKRGCKVSFDTEDQGGRHLVATQVTVEPREKKPLTGHGKWVGTEIKYRVRCTDCHVTTDLRKPPFCPHCGAEMENSPLHTENGKFRKSGAFVWTKIEYGFRCDNCQKVSPYPFKFCPHCGVRTAKEVKDYIPQTIA